MKKFKNYLPGVPLVESPFFNDFIETVEDEEIKEIGLALNKDGFAVIDFPDDRIMHLANSIIDKLSPVFDVDNAIKTGEFKIGRIQDAWQDIDEVREIAINKRISEILTTLYGRKTFPFQTLNFPTGTGQHYHTDAVHFSSLPEKYMCGVWVALEDIDHKNGALEYYPGSHKIPFYMNEHYGFDFDLKRTQGDYEEAWQALVKAYNLEKKVFTPKKGQCLIWCSNLLHGGIPHKDKSKTRWSQVTHYYFEDCVYFTPMHSELFSGNAYIRNTVINIENNHPVPLAISGKELEKSYSNFLQKNFFIKSRKWTLMSIYNHTKYIISKHIKTSNS